MSKKMASLFVAGAVAVSLLGGAGVAAAGDQLRTQDRDRLKDGSCQVAGIQLRTQDRDRLKDASCTTVKTRARLRTRAC